MNTESKLKKRLISFFIDDNLRKYIKLLALDENISMNKWLTQAVKLKIEKDTGRKIDF